MDYFILRSRLRGLMKFDPFSDANGKYIIRSLYFDSPGDRALKEKLDGVDVREKFRIRFYNFNTDFIRLEKKSKLHGLNNKRSVNLSLHQAMTIINKDWVEIRKMKHPLIIELYSKMINQQLQPKTIVQYLREAYVYKPGNVRITFDSELKSGLFSTNFFDPNVALISPPDPLTLIEVKYDQFIPDVIERLLQLGDTHPTAFSKYATCRIYG